MDKNKATILITENQERFLEYGGSKLLSNYFECEFDENKESLAYKIQSNAYNAVIYNMAYDEIYPIRKARENSPSPIILITNKPTVESIIRAANSHIVGIVTFPIQSDELIRKVNTAVKMSLLRKLLVVEKDRYESHIQILDLLSDNLVKYNEKDIHWSLKSYFDICVHNMIYNIKNLIHVSDMLSNEMNEKQPCHLLNCPKLKTLNDSIYEAIEVLEKTKGSFKSKELAKLRSKLENVLAQNKV